MPANVEVPHEGTATQIALSASQFINGGYLTLEQLGNGNQTWYPTTKP